MFMSEDIKPPPLLEQAKNLTTALSGWVKSGFVKVDEKTFKHRLSICTSCDYWNPKGFGGLGQCKMCGCSIGKLHLPASRCPLKEPKWGTVNAA
jgi:hypothetical protein